MQKHLFPLVAIACCLGVQATVSGKEMTCSECIYVSKILEGELHKLEQGTDKGGLIGGVTQRRKMSNPRSEPKMYATLDSLCSKVSSSSGHHSASLQQPCTELIARIRGPLETDIFASGPAHVRRSMCTDLGGLCPVHQLYDSGEL